MIHGEIGETVAGVLLNNNTGSTKPEHNKQGRKIEDRLEMAIHNGHDTGVMNWYNAGLRVISKTLGLPIVGDSKNYTRQ